MSHRSLAMSHLSYRGLATNRKIAHERWGHNGETRDRGGSLGLYSSSAPRKGEPRGDRDGHRACMCDALVAGYMMISAPKDFKLTVRA